MTAWRWLAIGTGALLVMVAVGAGISFLASQKTRRRYELEGTRPWELSVTGLVGGLFLACGLTGLAWAGFVALAAMFAMIQRQHRKLKRLADPSPFQRRMAEMPDAWARLRHPVRSFRKQWEIFGHPVRNQREEKAWRQERGLEQVTRRTRTAGHSPQKQRTPSLGW